MKKRIACQIAVFVVVCWCVNLSTIAAANSTLSNLLDRIFNRHEFDEKHFGPIQWLDNGAAYTTLEPSPEFSGSPDAENVVYDLVRYDTATGQRTILVRAAQLVVTPDGKPLAIEDYAWSSDHQRLLLYTNSKHVWRAKTRGDYWLLDMASNKLRKLGGDIPESSMMFAKFSPDGQSVAWVYANNLYREDLANRKIRQLTSDGSATRINGTFDWVNEEEFKDRDGFRWSPDGKFIAYWQFDTSGVGVFTLLNDTAQQYPAIQQFPFPFTGGTNSAVRVGVLSVETGQTRWMNVPGGSRNHYIPEMEWARNSTQLILQHLNRLQNTNEVLLADIQTGAVRKLFEDTDTTWVDRVDPLLWMDGGKRFLWLSDRDGWRHAYVASTATGELQRITSSPADVVQAIAVAPEDGWFYYLASPENATQRYLYRVNVNHPGEPERVTPKTEPGTHSVQISPDGHWAFDTYFTFDHSPVIRLVHLPDHQITRVVENNADLAKSVAAMPATTSEFIQVTIPGGITLDGWMIKPHDFDAAKKYPALLYVYGGPANATVTDAWGGQRELFHRAIANEGYIVISFDSQGTPAPKGREWRKSIYHKLGILPSIQQPAALQQLINEHPYIDASRLAVWGWSDGGSNTLNLMFHAPNLFKAGMSVAPVSNQLYYDTIYMERYMGLPADNKQAYHDASAINFADQLSGNLLIVHGSGDDNVHFQVTELLLNRLIALGKPFDFMDYPNRTHSISEGEGTSYHLYSLLARYLETHVSAGGVAQ